MKVWALVELTIRDQTYKPGSELDLPRNTDQEKADFDRMVADQVVTTKPTQAERVAPSTETQSGRTGRQRRA